MNHHNISPDLSFCYIGPSLDKGPLPALFYFSLSAQDSLLLSPFNTPITYLKHLTHSSLRIFSLTIPGHENNLPKEKALETWASAVKKSVDPITPYITDISRTLEYLFTHNVLSHGRIAFAGLSRGAYIATLAAAKNSCCNIVLGFAPLVNLAKTKEFAELQEHPLALALNLHQVLPALVRAKVRFYIGNRDTRVDTKEAFSCITSLAQLAYAARAKEGSFQLMIHDSVGLMGHGTPDGIFAQGAQWIQEMLNLQ